MDKTFYISFADSERSRLLPNPGSIFMTVCHTVFLFTLAKNQFLTYSGPACAPQCKYWLRSASLGKARSKKRWLRGWRWRPVRGLRLINVFFPPIFL